jgi:hypothetical protein
LCLLLQHAGLGRPYAVSASPPTVRQDQDVLRCAGLRRTAPPPQHRLWRLPLASLPPLLVSGFYSVRYMCVAEGLSMNDDWENKCPDGSFSEV